MARLLFSFSLLFTLSYCAKTAEGPSVSHRALLTGVPHIVQTTDYSCGPATLLALLEYYGVRLLNEAILIRDAKTTEEEGTELEDMAAAAKRYGLDAHVRFDFTIEELDHLIRTGHPVIVNIQAWRENETVPWSEDWKDGHYVVAIGMEGDKIYFMDPSVPDGGGVLDVGDFLQRWHDVDRAGRQLQHGALFIQAVPKPAARWIPIK